MAACRSVAVVYIYIQLYIGIYDNNNGNRVYTLATMMTATETMPTTTWTRWVVAKIAFYWRKKNETYGVCFSCRRARRNRYYCRPSVFRQDRSFTTSNYIYIGTYNKICYNYKLRHWSWPLSFHCHPKYVVGIVFFCVHIIYNMFYYIRFASRPFTIYSYETQYTYNVIIEIDFVPIYILIDNTTN